MDSRPDRVPAHVTVGSTRQASIQRTARCPSNDRSEPRIRKRYGAPVSDRRPRIRAADLPDTAVLVVRGDELDPELLATDATNFFDRFVDFGRYGISAFYASQSAEVDVLCETKLSQFATIAIFQRADVEDAGIEIIPTFRTPHVTLAHTDRAELIRRLLGCNATQIDNPYHET